MDIKLPSTAGTPPLWEAHAAFLRVALARVGAGAVQVKVVFGAELDEVERAVAAMRGISAASGGPTTSTAASSKPVAPPSHACPATTVSALTADEFKDVLKAFQMLRRWRDEAENKPQMHIAG